jgi:hypothetical protein
MAIGFRAQTEIASGGATDPLSAPALPTGTQNGDMVVYGVIIKYGDTTTIVNNPPTDWQDPANNEANNTGSDNAGNDDGNIRLALFFREKDASWSTLPQIDPSILPNCTMVGAISYSKGAGEAWDTPVCATAVDNTASSTGIDPAASGTTISFASGDWFGAFAGINGDAGTPTVPMTVTVAGVTFGAATTRWNGQTSSGTDLRGHSIDRTYTSGTASAGPDGVFTLTTGAATGIGVMIFYRLRVTSGAITGTAANTQADQTSAASGQLGYSGTSATTQADQTSTASGQLGSTGTVAVTQADQTSDASGTVTAGGAVTGTAANTQDDQTSTASGQLGYSGTVAVTQADQTSTASGTVTAPGVTGTAAIVQDDQTSAASGTVTTPGITGTAAITQDDQVSSAEGGWMSPEAVAWHALKRQGFGGAPVRLPRFVRPGEP